MNFPDRRRCPTRGKRTRAASRATRLSRCSVLTLIFSVKFNFTAMLSARDEVEKKRSARATSRACALSECTRTCCGLTLLRRRGGRAAVHVHLRGLPAEHAAAPGEERG